MGVILRRPMLVSAAVIGTLLPDGALRQEMATPGPCPQTPDPAACVVEALPADDVLAVLADASATPAVATPDAVLAQGTPGRHQEWRRRT